MLGIYWALRGKQEIFKIAQEEHSGGGSEQAFK